VQENANNLKHGEISADMTGWGDSVRQPQVCKVAGAIDVENLYNIETFGLGR
jgi:hypothetical protein